MAKTKAYVPPHYADKDAYAADLERELAGRRNRLAELKAMGVREDDKVWIETLSEEEAALEQLRLLGHGQQAAAKRPAARAAEKR